MPVNTLPSSTQPIGVPSSSLIQPVNTLSIRPNVATIPAAAFPNFTALRRSAAQTTTNTRRVAHYSGVSGTSGTVAQPFSVRGASAARTPRNAFPGARSQAQTPPSDSVLKLLMVWTGIPVEHTESMSLNVFGPILPPIPITKTLELTQATITGYIQRSQDLDLTVTVTLDADANNLADPSTLWRVISQQVETFFETNQLILPPPPNSSSNPSNDHRALWGILKPKPCRFQTESNTVRRFNWASEVQETGGILLTGLLAIAKDPLLRYPQKGRVIFFGPMFGFPSQKGHVCNTLRVLWEPNPDYCDHTTGELMTFRDPDLCVERCRQATPFPTNLWSDPETISPATQTNAPVQGAQVTPSPSTINQVTAVATAVTVRGGGGGAGARGRGALRGTGPASRGTGPASRGTVRSTMRGRGSTTVTLKYPAPDVWSDVMANLNDLQYGGPGTHGIQISPMLHLTSLPNVQESAADFGQYLLHAPASKTSLLISALSHLPRTLINRCVNYFKTDMIHAPQQAVWRGPLRSIFHATLQTMLSTDDWDETESSHGAKVLRVDLPVTEAFKTRVKGYALFTAMWMIRMDTLPPGISPIFIQAVIQGTDSIDDMEWLATILPSMARCLRLWPISVEQDNPFQNTAHLDYTLLTNLAYGAATFTKSDLHQMTMNEIVAFRKALIEYQLLRQPVNTGATPWTHHPIIQTFREALAIPLVFDHSTPKSDWRGTFIDALGSNTKSLLSNISPKIRISAADILPYIDWTQEYDPEENAELVPYQAMWRQGFERWIRQPGNLKHPELVKLGVNDSAFDDDPYFRSHGVRQLPRGTDMIKLKFVKGQNVVPHTRYPIDEVTGLPILPPLGQRHNPAMNTFVNYSMTGSLTNLMSHTLLILTFIFIVPSHLYETLAIRIIPLKDRFNLEYHLPYITLHVNTYLELQLEEEFSDLDKHNVSDEEADAFLANVLVRDSSQATIAVAEEHIDDIKEEQWEEQQEHTEIIAAPEWLLCFVHQTFGGVDDIDDFILPDTFLIPEVDASTPRPLEIDPTTPHPSDIGNATMVPPLSSPLDTYLRTQFSTQAAWVDIVRNSDYSIGGVSLGAAYRLFLQHRVVLDVCQAFALNINSPSTAYAEVYSEGTSDPSFTITVTDIMNWSGRASGTYRNNKSLMQRTVAAIQE
ncbi:hypothetical protein BDZ89DRAFT_1045963 [Hymenopellis radicata]|nr:hypothetical protein BDZ89DRAFT_1045963 [Hymenopellis radicata]